MSLFGTSGIRDLCPSIVSPILAQILGSILAKKSKKIVLGHDGRNTGDMLKHALCSGAMQNGADVLDIGLCTTPTLANYTKTNNCFGAMITASHNPAKYNGIKLFSNGAELAKEIEMEIDSQLTDALKTAKAERTGWDSTGDKESRSEDAKKEHLKVILDKIDTGVIRKKRPKVVLDAGHLSGCALSKRALESIGCTVIAINDSIGEPFNRALEPNEKSLDLLCKKVVDENADLGVAHDGDADRAIIIDERGKMLGLDVQLAVTAEQILKKGQGKTIVSTVESSLSLIEVIKKHDSILEITPVGSLNVARKMRQVDAIFGGEPCGEYIFKDGVQVPDGLMVGCFFAELFSKEGALSSLAKEINTYPMHREKIGCENKEKEKAMQKIVENWPFENATTVDGIRSTLADGWIMVRPSGTEPIIRITAEAKDEKKLGEMVDIARRLVGSAIN